MDLSLEEAEPMNTELEKSVLNHPHINGRVPFYKLQIYQKRPDNAKIRAAINNFFQLGRNWMCCTAPNLQSLVKAKKKRPAIHSLLLQHSYLLASELAAAFIKV